MVFYDFMIFPLFPDIQPHFSCTHPIRKRVLITLITLHSSVVWFYKSCRLAWKNNGFTLWLFSLNILLVLCACAPIKISPYPIDRVETLGQSMTKQDVTVSLHVLNDPDDRDTHGFRELDTLPHAGQGHFLGGRNDGRTS